MKVFFSIAFLLFAAVLYAQSPEDIIKTSRDFSMKADLDNAILTLKNGLDKYPDNADIRIELAMAYYSVKRNRQAMDVLQPLFANDQADEVAYQIAGLVFRSEQNPKEAEKTYKAGLKKFPNSGFLYNEYGQFMGTNLPGRGEDIKLWEKGIEVDPKFAGNYYQACRYYAVSNNTLWTLLYGEIFVNLDSYSSRTVEIKNILFQFYKKAFAFGFNGLNSKNEFEDAVAKTLYNQKQLAASGLNPENLSAIRTRFILEWFNGPLGEKYPFRLFERQQNMLREGMFDAYNQWLFGGAANLAAFQNWTKSHADEYQNFSKYQRQKLFVLHQGQYYR
jgi:tetratricopeptide (TPR) repeat protein